MVVANKLPSPILLTSLFALTPPLTGQPGAPWISHCMMHSTTGAEEEEEEGIVHQPPTAILSHHHHPPSIVMEGGAYTTPNRSGRPCPSGPIRRGRRASSSRPLWNAFVITCLVICQVTLLLFVCYLDPSIAHSSFYLHPSISSAHVIPDSAPLEEASLPSPPDLGIRFGMEHEIEEPPPLPPPLPGEERSRPLEEPPPPSSSIQSSKEVEGQGKEGDGGSGIGAWMKASWTSLTEGLASGGGDRASWDPLQFRPVKVTRDNWVFFIRIQKTGSQTLWNRMVEVRHFLVIKVHTCL